jgi:hypothetical protein
MKEPTRDGHTHECRAFSTTTRLAKYEHSLAVSAKLLDVVPHPMESESEVKHSGIARMFETVPEFGQIEEAKRIEPVIQRYDDHIAAPAKVEAIVERVICRAAAVCAAVNVYHDRSVPAIAKAGCPDVEVQAVFTHWPLFRRKVIAGIEPSLAGELRGSGAKRIGFANFDPGYGRKWGHESAGRGICPVRDAFEDINAIFERASYSTRCDTQIRRGSLRAADALPECSAHASASGNQRGCLQ